MDICIIKATPQTVMVSWFYHTALHYHVIKFLMFKDHSYNSKAAYQAGSEYVVIVGYVVIVEFGRLHLITRVHRQVIERLD